VNSQVDQGKVIIDLALRKTRPERLQLIRLRVPHPTKQRMKQVTVNGSSWKDFSPDQEVIELKPSEDRYQVVIQY